MDLLFIPICNGVHWIMATIDIKQQRIIFTNSQYVSNETWFGELKVKKATAECTQNAQVTCKSLTDHAICNNKLLELFRSVGVVERPSEPAAINAWIRKNEREFKGLPSLLDDGTMIEMLDLISLFSRQDVSLMALNIAMVEIVKEEAEMKGAKVEVFTPDFMAFYDVDESKGKCWEDPSSTRANSPRRLSIFILRWMFHVCRPISS
jgi:Ulp1 protease family, C-terminal catalytic domain